MFLVQACGEFDADEVDLFLAAWEEADERALPATVVGLTGCVLGDSSFLGALLIARSRHLASGRQLVLAGPLQPRILLLLAVSGTMEAFDVTGTWRKPSTGVPADASQANRGDGACAGPVGEPRNDPAHAPSGWCRRAALPTGTPHPCPRATVD